MKLQKQFAGWLQIIQNSIFMSIIFSCNSITPLRRKVAVAKSEKPLETVATVASASPSTPKLASPTRPQATIINTTPSTTKDKRSIKPENQHSHCQEDQRTRSTKSRSQTNASANHKIERRHPNPPTHIGDNKTQSSSSSASESTKGFLLERFCFFVAGSKSSVSSSSVSSSSSSSSWSSSSLSSSLSLSSLTSAYS